MKRITAFLLLLLCLLMITTGCTETAPKSESSAPAGVEFTDALGHTIRVTDCDRVVVASGSFAQTWLLAGGTLAGTTDDSFKDDLGLSEDVTNVGSLHSPNLESILALNPSLVILSADISGHTDLADQLNAAHIPTAYFSVEVFEDYLNMLKICTEITGRDDLYEKNGRDVQKQVQEIIARTAGNPSPKVLFLRAGAGKVAARNSDTMAGAMLKDMGCTNIADSETGLLDNLSMEVIIQENPDFIFATTMGDSEEKAKKALQDTLLSNPAWASLSAVKNGRYVTLPKEMFHQKPNNRWAEAYEQLWEILYGEQ